MTEQQTRKQGRPVMDKFTAGRQICCQWKDGSIFWGKLFDLKESHPVQTAEFAIAQVIDYKPAFNWWVKHMLKKRDKTIASIIRQ